MMNVLKIVNVLEHIINIRLANYEDLQYGKQELKNLLIEIKESDEYKDLGIQAMIDEGMGR